MKSILRKILFIDIETVRLKDHYDEMDDRLKASWERKAVYLGKDLQKTPEEIYHERAGTKALYHEDEHQLLNDFVEVLARMNQDELMLCAHNGKEFDFPYLSRRMRINRIPLPQALDISGKKPWEIQHLDTMEMWKFGDFRHYTSLDLLAALFGVESSKVVMDGADVGHTFYEDKDPEKIMTYCLKDVEVTARIFMHLKGWHDIDITLEEPS